MLRSEIFSAGSAHVKYHSRGLQFPLPPCIINSTYSTRGNVAAKAPCGSGALMNKGMGTSPALTNTVWIEVSILSTKVSHWKRASEKAGETAA